MKEIPYPIGSKPSVLRSKIRRLGPTIREQAHALGWPHATLGRRLRDPGKFTLNETVEIEAKIDEIIRISKR